jgi:hypothetical protein
MRLRHHENDRAQRSRRGVTPAHGVEDARGQVGAVDDGFRSQQTLNPATTAAVNANSPNASGHRRRARTSRVAVLMAS